MKYTKLVRDRIPEIIAASGERPVTRTLGDEEYDEFKEALNLEELADLQEVLLALADVIASREELETARSEKATKRGIFKDRIFLERTE